MLRTTEAGPKITLGDVESLEARHGIKLPDQYREFLTARNGGRPERDLFRVPNCEANPIARVHFFFGIDDPVESCDLAWNIGVFSWMIRRRLIPIATTEGADKICLDADSGAVSYWDGYEDKLYLVSNDFAAFLRSLFRDDSSPPIVSA